MSGPATSAALSPEDADAARTGGEQVARMCVGLTPDDFMIQLKAAVAKMRGSLRKAGVPQAIAHLAVAAFETGALVEWQRVFRPEQVGPWGRA